MNLGTDKALQYEQSAAFAHKHLLKKYYCALRLAMSRFDDASCPLHSLSTWF